MSLLQGLQEVPANAGLPFAVSLAVKTCCSTWRLLHLVLKVHGLAIVVYELNLGFKRSTRQSTRQNGCE